MRFRTSILVLVTWLAVLASPGSLAESFRMWSNIGPPGGDLVLAATDPADALHAAVMGVDFTVFETLDGGTSWAQRGNIGNVPFYRRLEIRGAAMYVSAFPQALRSFDHGRTWEPFPVAGEMVVLHPTNSSLMALATYGDIRISRDGGATWTAYTQYYETDLWDVIFDRNLNEGFLAIRNKSGGTPAGGSMMLARNVGLGWNDIAMLNSDACYGRSLAQDANGELVVASDCGVWTTAMDGGGYQVYPGQTFGVDGLPLNFSKVVADPLQAGHLALKAGISLFATRDRGRTWTRLESARYGDVAVARDGALWTAEGSLAYRTTFSGTRTALAVPQRAARASDLTVVGRDPAVLFTDAYYNSGVASLRPLRSVDGGATWGLIDPSINVVYGVPGDASAAYATAGITFPPSGNRLWSSEDRGGTWTQISMSGVSENFFELRPVGRQPGVIYASPIAFTSTGGYSQSVAYGSEVLRSADGGHTWTSIDSGIGGKGRSICVTPADTRVVFVTTDAGVFRTRDAGTTWQLVWSAAERGGGAGIVVDSVNASLVYAQGPGGLWISEDGGDHWQMAPLPNPAAFGLLPDPVDSGRLFVATQAGAVFESRDKGATWNQLSPDVPDIGGTFDYVTHPAIVANGAQRAIAAVAKSTVLRLDLPTAALGVGTALWLNPDQLGWGLSLAQHDNGQVFAVWFTYDAAGKPRWYFVPGGEWSRGTIFAGTLYEAHAAPRDFFTTSFDASSVIKTRVGQMRLEFANSESGTAAFSLDDGTTVVQPIRRALFGKPVGGQPNMGDLWFNPAESGWGITLHQQYNTVFATWFVYDTDGSPTWLVMPDAAHNYGVITGDVYRPAAASTGMPFVASGVSTHKVGTARTSGMLDTELSATIDGKSWARPITRIPF